MTGHVMQNMGTEGAMEWVLGHMEDANFNEPMSQPSETAAPAQTSAAGSASAGPAADPETVMMLVSMGFTDAQAAAALKVGMLCCLLGTLLELRLGFLYISTYLSSALVNFHGRCSVYA